VRTYKTLCYRKISHLSFQHENNISFVVPLPKQEEMMSLHDINSCLISDFVGIDCIQALDNSSNSEASTSMQLLSASSDAVISNLKISASKTARPSKKTNENVTRNKAKSLVITPQPQPDSVNYNNTDSQSANHPSITDVNTDVNCSANRPQHSKLEDFWPSTRSNEYSKSAFLGDESDCKHEVQVSQDSVHSDVSFGNSLKQFEFSHNNNPTVKESTFKSPKVVRNTSYINRDGNHSESIPATQEVSTKKNKSNSSTVDCAPILNVELALVRSKATELQLNNVPVKRLRNNYSHLTAASPRNAIQPVRNNSTTGGDNSQLPPMSSTTYTNVSPPLPVLSNLPPEAHGFQQSQDSVNSAPKHLTYKSSSKRPIQQSFFDTFMDEEDDDSTIREEEYFRSASAKSASQESCSMGSKALHSIHKDDPGSVFLTHNKQPDSNHTLQPQINSSTNRDTVPVKKVAVINTLNYRTPSPKKVPMTFPPLSYSNLNTVNSTPFHNKNDNAIEKAASSQQAPVLNPVRDDADTDNFDNVFF